MYEIVVYVILICDKLNNYNIGIQYNIIIFK